MENSYFRSPWNPNHTNFRDNQNLTPKTKRKFVSIPVHFVESAAESNRKHSAAVRIQKLVRGFLVRKKVGAVRRIEREVEEVEWRIERDLDLLLREEKERIRINEMLMALLLRLDTVRGVRDYRRKVIRTVISMQESVDALSSVAAKSGEAGGEEDAATREYQKSLGIEGTPGQEEEEAALDVQETLETNRNLEFPEGTLVNQESEVHENLGTITDQEVAEETLENQGEAVPEFQETPVNSDTTESEFPEMLENTRDEGIKNQEASQEEIKAGFFVVDPMKSLKSEERTGEDQEIPVKEIGVVDEKVFLMEEDGWSIIESVAKPSKTEESGPKPSETEEYGPRPSKPSEELGLKGMMGRMLAENESLKGLVVELCERSTMQCKLMGRLAKRVEQLEKTVQAMERRKKNKLETNSALASEE